MNYSILISLLVYSSCLALDTEWWRHTIIYEILPYSYKDSNGDGIGDLKGITSQLDHFVDLGIKTIHFTPIYASPFKDMGYDISNYCEINPRYGTMEDFDQLMNELKKRDMKLILDLVINHSSYEHEWFLKSINKTNPYTDFYVWMDAKGFYGETKTPIPPNGWTSIFGGSAWTWNENRQQFYFHQFLLEQPDFNLNNKILVEELKKMITFWLDKGVAGFRLDAVTSFFEDKLLRDDDNYFRQFNQEETYPFVHKLRLFLDEYSKSQGDYERIFVPEAHSADDFVLRFYDRDNYPMTQLPYYFNLEYIGREIDANELDNFIQPWMNKIPKNAVSLWITQDHDCWRVGTRIRPEYSDIMTMISMMLPGSVGIYYGQEIAMLNGYVREEQIKDFSGHGGRDPARLIMQWDNGPNGGFSSNMQPYLPPNSDFFIRNVEAQKTDKSSHYNMFKNLSALRQTDTFKYGHFKQYIPSKFIYIFTRSFKNHLYIIIINLNTLLSRVRLSEVTHEIPSSVTVAAASVNSGYEQGSSLVNELTVGFFMRPLSCVVFEGTFLDDS